MQCKDIPVVAVDTLAHKNKAHYCKPLLANEIDGVQVEHVALAPGNSIQETRAEDTRTVYLFINGTGKVTTDHAGYEVVAETIFLPNAIKSITINSTDDSALHFLKICCKLSTQDLLELQSLPAENTQQIYHAKFSECQPYTEAIKSPNTVSRTILSNNYIPRVAMGTVQTTGPDKVAPHKHPMLEQLFLGLSENKSTVYADDSSAVFPEFSLLHIPLGSSHSVSVKQNDVMYYVWMDFFLDKEGEEWLKTHKVAENASPV